MLTNEQRAHDLAIAAMTVTVQAKLNEPPVDGVCERSIDFYEYYKNSYDIALETFNHDFPEKP